MKGQVLASVRWRPLSGQGHDGCRLVAADGGFMLIGHARLAQDGHEAQLDYVVRCDPSFVTLGADVTGRRDGERVGWKIARLGAGWEVNGEIVPGAQDCVDVDLGFTPATNLLPLRRLDGKLDTPTRIDALWLRWPEARPRILEQRYHRLTADEVSYRSAGYAAVLTVDPSGFVTRYPGGWEGTMDAG